MPFITDPSNPYNGPVIKLVNFRGVSSLWDSGASEAGTDWSSICPITFCDNDMKFADNGQAAVGSNGASAAATNGAAAAPGTLTLHVNSSAAATPLYNYTLPDGRVIQVPWNARVQCYEDGRYEVVYGDTTVASGREKGLFEKGLDFVVDTITYPVEAAKSIIVGATEFATSVYYPARTLIAQRLTESSRSRTRTRTPAWPAIHPYGRRASQQRINVMKGISTGYVYFAASVPMLANPGELPTGSAFTERPQFDNPGANFFDGAAGDAPLIEAPGVQGVTDFGEQVAGHHPWPQYLGGPANQPLEWLPGPVHNAYHGGLDAWLPRQWGCVLHKLTPLEQAQNFELFRTYTQAFDSQYGTSLWDAVKAIAGAR